MALFLFLVILIGVIAAAGLVGHGFSALARRATRRPSAQVLLSAFAAFTGAAAVGLGVWGALHVAAEAVAAADGGTESSPLRTFDVPGYVAPTALALAATAVGLAICAGFVTELGIRSRTPPAKTSYKGSVSK